MTLRLRISEAIVCVSEDVQFENNLTGSFLLFFHEIDYIHAVVDLSKGNGILRHEMRRLLFSKFSMSAKWKDLE